MSVTRIAEAVQPATLVRTAGLAIPRIQAKIPQIQINVSGFSVVWKTGSELLLVMLNPVALAAFVLAIWRLSQDMEWTSNFFIGQGLFSHWQVWLGLALALKAIEVLLSRVQTEPVSAKVSVPDSNSTQIHRRAA